MNRRIGQQQFGTLDDDKQILLEETLAFHDGARAEAHLPEQLQGFELEGSEEQLVALIDGKRTLFELCEQGPFSAGLNARVLYALSILGLIKKEKEREGGAPIKVHVSQSAP